MVQNVGRQKRYWEIFQKHILEAVNPHLFTSYWHPYGWDRITQTKSEVVACLGVPGGSLGFLMEYLGNICMTVGKQMDKNLRVRTDDVWCQTI